MGGPKRRRLTKVDAGSILTTLFAVSCSASMEDAASLDYVKLLEAAIESKTAYVDIADHEGFARRAKSYKNKAIAAGVPAITNSGANPGVRATFINNAQRESKGQPERLRYHYFTAGNGGNGPGVLATSFYLIADESKMMLKPYSDKLSIDFGEGIGNKNVFLITECVGGGKRALGVWSTNYQCLVWYCTLLLELDTFSFHKTHACCKLELLKDKNIVQLLSKVSYPFIRAVDKISGEKAAIRVDLQCTDGYNAAAIFSRERLAEAVGTATAAFVLAVLEGSTAWSLVSYEYLIANCWIVVIVVWCIVIQVPQHNKFWSLDGGENGAAVRFHYLKMGQSSPPHSTYRHDLKIYSSDEGRVHCFCQWKVHAGSILTTLFAVSCSASIEDAASLDYDVDLVVHAAGPFEYADSKLLEAAIESKTAYVDIADHEGFARCPKSYKNKAMAAGVPAITNAEANPGVSSLMAATLIHNAQQESKGQPERLRYHYFTAGSGGNGPGVLATSFYLIADEGAKMMLKPYIDKLNIDFGEGIHNKDVFLIAHERTFEGQKHSSTVVETILSIIRAVDKISGEKAAKRGYNAAAIFSHERLTEAVGTATTAFVLAVLEETQSLEFGILKR
ncbi:hypothetical protein OROGR_025296 [Orobanche gracilis]